ncbi:hypothetical protein MKW94_008214 [Papaver nudicaule]|uniref:DUF4378 domain-containing protein n=1 Tax=Papaver nudicaule TaxID=74823 RepID=A0AA41VRB1_PAPNU|nr:hypothetical protein [Papaver nudicaule]
MEIEKAKKKPVMERKIVLLKDFLKEEMSSCSSNGFKSFPRKTCCTSYSIRHLVDMDLKSRDLTKNPSFPKNHHLLRNKSSSTTTTAATSAFQKASVAVINVVKYLTFSSSSSKSSSLTSSPSTKKSSSSLSRSVSKKLKSKSFWRKNSEKNSRKVEKEIKDAGRVKDIMKWKSFRELHKRSSSSLSIQTITTTTNTIYSWSPSSSDSESDQHINHSHEFNKSFKQKQKDITESDLHCSSSISIGGISNSDCLPVDHDSDNKLNQKQEIVVVEEEEFSIKNKGELRGEQGHHQYGKVQQFNSPVSTLDFPCEEDEEETSSSSSSSLFQSSLANMEKSKKKLMHKIRRFEGLGQLDPINLSKRIASFEAILSHDSLESPSDSYASSIFTSGSCSNIISSVSEQQEEEEEEEEEDQMSKAEEKAKKLFQCTIKETTRTGKSLSSVEDLLLLDFFKDEIIERTTNERVVVSKRVEEKLDNELLRLAKNWMDGQCDPLDWGLQESRKVHLNEMEKGGHWRINNEDIVFEMEIMIMGSLMGEVLADLLS